MPTREEARRTRSRTKLRKQASAVLDTLKAMQPDGAGLTDEEADALFNVVQAELSAACKRLKDAATPALF